MREQHMSPALVMRERLQQEARERNCVSKNAKMVGLDGLPHSGRDTA